MKYETLIIEPIRDMFIRVINFIPTLVTAVAILVIGYVLARLLTKLVVTFLRAVEFDKISARVGLTKVLKTGDIKDKPSSLVGCLFYWVMMVGVLITTVKAFGLVMATSLLDKVLAYIPNIFAGVFVLIIGMLLAKFISVVIYLAAKNTDMPIPEVLARVSKWAIIAYVMIIYLKEIGFVSLFVGTNYTIFITGIVFALALSFGLAGKDIAGRYLNVLNVKNSK